MSSPAKNRSGTRLDSMVAGSISRVETPPRVTMASSMGRGPKTAISKFFASSQRRLRWARVMEWTFCPGSMPLRRMITGISFAGNRSHRAFS